MKSRILITGSSGFIGRGLVARLAAEKKYQLRLALRGKVVSQNMTVLCDQIEVGNIDGNTNWGRAVDGVDVVVHLAARAHVLRDKAKNPLREFRDTNWYGTQQLARAAALSGVKRFVYISSIGVNGVQTDVGAPFTELDPPRPHNAYAISKWEAERALTRLSEEAGMEFVIIRPPLVYGKDAPGNFGQLLRVVAAGIPLPLGAVHNLRSFVALDNLVDFIDVCCSHPEAANQIFLISDGRDISTPELIRGIAESIHRHAFLFPVPSWFLTAGATLLGKRGVIQGLCGYLQVDNSKARKLLEWEPPVSVDEGLRRATGLWRTC